MTIIRTKIICTMGPACHTVDKILDLMRAGMNVARLNFSHGTQAEHLMIIDNLKEARRLLGMPLSIMLDTKGPEIRLGKIKDGQILLTSGQKWRLLKHEKLGDENQVSVFPGEVLNNLPEGTRVLFDDGYIASHIVENLEDSVVVQIDNGGIIRSGKGVNIPNTSVNLPPVTNKDIEDIRFGCQQDIDLIAASFVRSAEHVLTIKRLLAEEKKPDILVIAKIENSEGVQNFDSIVQAADGIMIARGDLGVEVPLSHVPRLQKMMIRKSYLAGKPVVTATQMLESMINNPRPTRAETSDVANAIYDSTSAVMLSGETAIGRYPVETVNVMRSIVEEAEADFNYRAFFDQHAPLVYHDVPSAVTLATVKTAYSSNAKAIFAFTRGGSTARLLSRLRPKMPIIAMTANEKSFHQLAFNWGVIPYLSEPCGSLDESFEKISSFALDSQLVSYGDLVVMTAGTPFGFSGTTNMMIVESIGDVLVRGHSGYGNRVHGNVTIVLAPESKAPYAVKDQLLVIARCDDDYLPLMREAAGIILQNHINDVESEKFAKKIALSLGKPVLLRADAACQILKEGQLITLDPEKALVYKGIVLD
ncbi:pyruvate kinase [Candidatus Protochlamydia naegleriophila]|uniref:Pyruvate kinase n=1 Tax=Candidatus Protochlamydia naegleriophila TaxID=389348 RepID=A0A0U5JDP2_9BACT|nr:pyruvate kinase [Candidatus Protochlamydia naegleriophila]CUI17229.1 pyruvate kinase [Candidatus Protochlamydia naegleriophila]